jgi:protein-tyrosine phosphatase
VTTVDAPRPFHVLAVCTGNICRSPAVERLLATGLGAPWPVGRALQGPAAGPGDAVVSSAGTGAVVGAPVSPPMVDLLHGAGVDAGGFAARQLTPDLLRSADLVLALTRRHRSAVVELFPGAVRRTFTLRELARLAAHVDPAQLPSGPGTGVGDRLRALVPLAAAQRGLVTAEPGDDDVVDPYGHSVEVYRRSYDELAPAVATLVQVVRG